MSQSTPVEPDPVDVSPPRGGRPARWRSPVVVVLVVLGALFTTLALPAIWARNLLLDTDRYVETVEPLAADPEIKDAVIKALYDAVTTPLDVSSVINEALPRVGPKLSGPLEAAIDSLVERTITQLVESDQFAQLWATLNRTAHQAFVRAMNGEQNPRTGLQVGADGTLTLDLGPLVEQVKQRLVDRGLDIAAQIPPTDKTIELADLSDLTELRPIVNLLDAVAYWLPVVGLAAFAGAVLLAQRHRRMVVVCALSAAGGLVVVGIALAVFRSVYLDAVPTDVLPAAAAGEVYDTVLRFLRTGLRVTLLVVLVVALVAWLAGRTPSPSVGAFLDRYRIWLSLAVVAAAGTAFVLWDEPSTAAILVLVALAIAALASIEVLRARRPAVESAPS